MRIEAMGKRLWNSRTTRRGSLFFALVLAALVVGPTRCAKPTGPSQFVTIRLLTQGDSITYTGVPLKIIAVFDSAVAIGEISWTTGRGTYTRPGNHRLEDTTRADTILLTWEQMPVRALYAPSDTASRNRPPIDTIWVEYRGNASNRIRVSVVNRAPRIDSIYVNGRRSLLLNDSLRISGNHGAMVYMKLFATDPDTGSELKAEWVGTPGFGSMITFNDSASLNPLQRTMVWRWNFTWKAPSVQSAGDSTLTSTASLIVHDRNGGVKSIPIRITIYRESGSIWVASTHENTSTLIKYASNGTELFRIPGFQKINCLAVSPKDEVVWLTDCGAGKVYCIDDDGNLRKTVAGFKNPASIDVSDEHGYCIVADEDSTAASMGARIRVVNKDGSGRIDTSVAALKLPGAVSCVKLDQREVNDSWILWQVPSSLDSTDKAAHYTSWWTLKSLIPAGTQPAFIDLNPITNHAWIADRSGNCVLRVNTKTDSVARVVGFLNPQMLSVNTRDSSCWVADTDHNQVVKILYSTGGFPLDITTGSNTRVKKFEVAFNTRYKQPQALAVNPNEGERGVVWVVDTQNNRIVKLNAADGADLLSIDGFGMETPRYIAVNTGTR